jgi:small subunit ribosomal protein S19
MARTKGGTARAARRKQRKKMGAVAARRKKEFTYRGKTLEELMEMPQEQVLELLPSRARRRYLRGLTEEDQVFIDKLRAAEDADAVRTHQRDLPILPDFVGKKVAVHNGKEFVEVEIKPEMIGHYLGEFAMTRRAVKHSGPGVGATRSSKFLPLK